MILEFDTADKIIGGTGLIGIALYAGRKMLSFWKAEGSAQASSAAVQSQFKSLQDAIEAQRKEMTVIRLIQERMDLKIHKQQTKLTRMEVLLRQFSSLVSEHGIDVPKYMRDELDDLIRPDERVETPDERAFP